MRKIVFDARKADDFGIGEYIKTIFGYISGKGIFENFILYNPDHPVVFGTKDTYIPIKSKNYNLTEQFEIPLKTFKKGDFLYFSPHYIFPISMRKKVIVTVHDLIHFKFPDFFKPKIKIKTGEFFLRTIKNNALKIFSVSGNTKTDMIEMFGFREDQISVIYNGINDDFFLKKKKSSPLKNPYLLYTGNIKPHKNISALIEAFRIVSPVYKDLKLVLAGAGEKLPDFLIHDDIKESLIITGYLSRSDLINYLDNCEIFIFPSFYEGFGFPPLEAMARGKSVISSPDGSLKEVLGDAPLYFNPYSPEDLSKKIRSVMENKTLRKDLESRGKKRAQKFTLKKSAESYMKELKEFVR